MRKTILAVLIAAAAVVPAAPALAQATDRVLVIFGTDRCPTNASGEEIVVCARRPESERFRIPKELRSPIVITPENQSWAAKANETLAAGSANAGQAGGAGSCSAVGPHGWTGCFQQQMRAARAERAQNRQVETTQP